MLRLKLQYSGHLMRRADSLEKTLMLGKTEKRTTEDEMVGWHYLLKGHEREKTLRDGEGRGNLTCCSPWGHKKLDTTWRLNNRHLHQLKYCSPIFWGLYYLRQKFCIFFIPCRKPRTQCLGKRQADYTEENLYLC